MKRFLYFLCCIAVVNCQETVNRKCRDLLTCIIQKKCIQLNQLTEKFRGATVNAKMYDDLDMSIDYGCIFTSGCQDECNRCPLCLTSKKQLVDVLTGSKRGEKGECASLVNCATDCVKKSGSNLGMINHCLRHICAYHCFDGSCYKCSAFVTRLFNQACVSGNFKKEVPSFKGQCFQLFKAIVYAKFEDEFVRNNKQPAIGVRPH